MYIRRTAVFKSWLKNDIRETRVCTTRKGGLAEPMVDREKS